MNRVAMAPAPLMAKEIRARAAAASASVIPHDSSLYIIQPAARLPIVNLTHTLAGQLAGPRHAHAANALALRLATSHYALYHQLYVVFAVGCILLFIVDTRAAQAAVSTAIAVSILPILVAHGLALCWDLLLLTMSMFEFWFLLSLVAVANVFWNLLFPDVRILAMITVAWTCTLMLFLDANLQLRVLVLRMFLFGAPGLVYAIVMITLRQTPGMRDTRVRVWDRTIDAVDIISSCTSSLVFFMTMRAARHRRLLCTWPKRAAVSDTKAPENKIQTTMQQCEMYFPVCRLIPYAEWQLHGSSIRVNPHAHLDETKTQLELVERDQLRLVDARDTLLQHRLINVTTKQTQVLVVLLNLVGVVGWVLMIVDATLQVAGYSPRAILGATVQRLSPTATLIVVVVHAAHYQRSLAHRIISQIDAWFVLFQSTVVTLCVADVFRWDDRVLVVATAWYWGLWIMFLDALPPSTRQHLALPRLFIVCVGGSLVLYPLWLTAMLYYPKDATSLHNRVLLHLHVANMDVELAMLSFTSSRLFTMWLWMGRFLWRELFRPEGAFRFIKYGVQFAHEPSAIIGHQ